MARQGEVFAVNYYLKHISLAKKSYLSCPDIYQYKGKFPRRVEVSLTLYCLMVKKAIRIQTNLKLEAADLFKYVCPTATARHV